MATHDIPREEWKGFLEEFTRLHQGSRVTMEAVDPHTSPQTEAQALPFVSISLEDEEQGEDGGSIVLLLEGDGEPKRVSHAIRGPRHLYHKPGAGVISSEVNPDEILEITAAGEPPITYLHFRHRKPG
ncbi:MAG TPA: DUF5335 family protein [Armatimonadaceae bacterium]|jgi:hypothetical protein|nr:DUF5335 family protein [Armatimonadaceae bacterium]